MKNELCFLEDQSYVVFVSFAFKGGNKQVGILTPEATQIFHVFWLLISNLYILGKQK